MRATGIASWAGFFGTGTSTVPFGEGCVDFLNVFRKLKALNYRGTFLIEMWTEKADEPVQEIINARRWIEAKMAEAGWSN